MTTEEKAKAYDEAMNKIKPLYEQAKRDGNPIWSTYEYLVPELRESEDERTKRMLNTITYKMSQHQPDIFTEEENEWFNAYLEKQKEQPTNEEMLRTLRTEYEKGVADFGKQKPAEWVGKYEKMLDAIIGILKLTSLDVYEDFEKSEMLDFLRSIRTMWKPSKECMSVLLDAANSYLERGYNVDAAALFLLYEQLQKLM